MLGHALGGVDSFGASATAGDDTGGGEVEAVACAERVLPRATPMKNSGVTSPPLKSALRVTTVKRSFQAHALTWISVEVNRAGKTMAFGRFPKTPRPR